MPQVWKKRLLVFAIVLYFVLLFVVVLLLVFKPGVTGEFLYNPPSGETNKENLPGFWTERIDAALQDSKCPVAEKLKFPETSYQGPLIDGHIHIPSIFTGGPNEKPGFQDTQINSTLGENLTMKDLVCVLENDSTSKAFAFFPVYREMKGPHLEIVKKTLQNYPDIFIPFIMPPDNDGSPTGFPTVEAKTLEEMLSIEPNLFKGYGEIGLYARDGGAPELPPDSSRLREIYPLVKKNKLAVYFHLGEGQRESYKKIIKENPDINFIFHGDQLIQCESCPQDLSQIEDILSSASNVFYEVDELWGDVWLLRPETTREQFFAHFKDYEPLLKKDLATWKVFIEKYPDQVIWGSDRGVYRWTVDLEVGRQLTDYVRAFIGRLDPEVDEKYAYKNVERIFAK